MFTQPGQQFRVKQHPTDILMTVKWKPGDTFLPWHGWEWWSSCNLRAYLPYLSPSFLSLSLSSLSLCHSLSLSPLHPHPPFCVWQSHTSSPCVVDEGPCLSANKSHCRSMLDWDPPQQHTHAYTCKYTHWQIHLSVCVTNPSFSLIQPSSLLPLLSTTLVSPAPMSRQTHSE